MPWRYDQADGCGQRGEPNHGILRAMPQARECVDRLCDVPFLKSISGAAMQRRDFLKISAASGAVAALEGCGNPDHQLIRFVPEEDLIPGVASWKPSICT